METRNAVNELDVDIVIDEGMDTPSIQAEQFDTLVKMLPALGPLAQSPETLKMMVQASQLRDKDKLLENGARWEAEIARNLEIDAPYR